MSQINVLIVDDSELAREFTKDILRTSPDFNVVGEAENGRQAVEMTESLGPDIVIMDIEMPVMNGLDAIEHIMAYHAVPILVVTGQGDSKVAYTAISRGALEVLPKDDIDPRNPRRFTDNVRMLSKVKVITHISGKRLRPTGELPPPRKNAFEKIVAIAASTGGPKALSEMLPLLPENYPFPIVVAQHIADGFIQGMVNWLDSLSKLKVKEAEEGETIKPGVVYISCPERHMTVDYEDTIRYSDPVAGEYYHPSCDVLLKSVSAVYGNRAIGVILTGMGRDGVEGLKRIRLNRGLTLAQDEETSIVFGMPKAAVAEGCVDKVLPLDRIAPKLMELARLQA